MGSGQRETWEHRGGELYFGEVFKKRRAQVGEKGENLGRTQGGGMTTS